MSSSTALTITPSHAPQPEKPSPVTCVVSTGVHALAVVLLPLPELDPESLPLSDPLPLPVLVPLPDSLPLLSVVALVPSVLDVDAEDVDIDDVEGALVLVGSVSPVVESSFPTPSSPQALTNRISEKLSSLRMPAG
jgi:hypothetical protein